MRQLLRVLVTLLLAGGMAWAGIRLLGPRRVPPPALVSAAPAPPPRGPDIIRDPIAPERPPQRDAEPRAATSANWITARPAFQYSKTAAERGGVNPCTIPPGDTSAFSAWSSLSRGRFSAPRSGALDAEGNFDLILHFHGDELARRELVQSGQPFVLYSLTLDPSESYAPLFSGSKLYSQLVEQIELSLTRTTGLAAHARRVALSAWSAGYMAVLAILVQPEAKDVDAVTLIDGLHGPRNALDHQLAPFVAYARRAATGERFMLITHSSIDPPGFASTSEASHYLLSALGVQPQAVRRDDGNGLELVEYFTRGDFHVRGYAGNDKADHCAQVLLLREGYAAIGRRWKTTATRTAP